MLLELYFTFYKESYPATNVTKLKEFGIESELVGQKCDREWHAYISNVHRFVLNYAGHYSIVYCDKGLISLVTDEIRYFDLR